MHILFVKMISDIIVNKIYNDGFWVGFICGFGFGTSLVLVLRQ